MKGWILAYTYSQRKRGYKERKWNREGARREWEGKKEKERNFEKRERIKKNIGEREKESWLLVFREIFHIKKNV